MAILRSDLPGLQKSSDALTDLILGAKAKEQQMQLQKNLAVQQAQEMLPIQKQHAQDTSEIDINKAKGMIPVDVAHAEAMTAPNAQAALAKEAALMPVKQQEEQNKAQVREEGLKRLVTGGLMPKGGSASYEGVSVHAPTASLLGLEDRKEARKEKQAIDYAKTMGKTSSFQSAADDLETVTNTDGKGGIFTNPNATIKGTGKIMSAMPTQVVAGLESLGIGEKGASEHRKAMERFKIEYMQAKSGMRVTDQQAKREEAALGLMASPDPMLAKKGAIAIKGLLDEMRSQAEAGYNKDVVQTVKDRQSDIKSKIPSTHSSGLSPQEQARLQELRAKRDAAGK